jgi:hypothetical protein
MENKILRVVNKQTGIFVRDDFSFDVATELGLDVAPAQGFAHPRWDGDKWVETPEADRPQVIAERLYTPIKQPSEQSELDQLKAQIEALRAEVESLKSQG